MSSIVVHEVATAAEGPYGVAITRDGAVWCTLVHAGAVLRVAPGVGSEGVTRIPIAASAAGAQVSQVTPAADDSVWVSDTAGDALVLVGASGVLRRVEVPTRGAQPFGVAAQADGTAWFTELGRDALGRIDLFGRVTEFPAGTDEGFVSMIASSGESLWFTANQANAIGYVRGGDSAVRLFEVPTPHAGPVGITVGHDGAAWFAEMQAGAIGRVDRSGVFAEFALPWSSSKPHAVAAAPDGSCLWATLWGSNELARVGYDGVVALVDLAPSGHEEPHGLAVAPDGTVWVAMESGALLEVAPAS
ncbi:virginiamycin B lyase [Herbiconiux moechotypicola]|uniref:Virginiamycin B lyase n=1 Tax=Herbiconiux moechotypicola TaxID=637393 RepID=A0ABP5QHP9_9MICO|nr:virginiamycin B lyase [Herbiconiux moechotypicola]MCS5729934.1 virginiamycin B lyase [Herbiconiux moechotypicola]